MRLHKLKIEGFRKVHCAEVFFGEATFLIGENNVGKSTVLAAIELLLSDKKKLEEVHLSMNSTDGENTLCVDNVVLTAEFRNVPTEIVDYRGFNHDRLGSYELDSSTTNETGRSITYRKTYKVGKDVEIEMLLAKTKLKVQFQDCKSARDFINAGADSSIFEDIEDKIKALNKAKKDKLNEISELTDIDSVNSEWIKNPGGIAPNVLSKLPHFILIPAKDNSEELSKGALPSILDELFREVRDQSENYQKAQDYLNRLALELNPNERQSEFGIMMEELNGVIDGVFPLARINAEASLSDPDKVLKPDFKISLSSNIKTPIHMQGTGMVRAAVFSLLRYRKQREEKRNMSVQRSIIIGFEEPEIYLHPNAANKMRDTIYDLACSTSQIICTTHSPYMIDLSKKPKQILNSLSINDSGFVKINPFNVSREFENLQENDKEYVKMVQKMDDYISRVFFAKKVIIIEGDTEDLVFKRTIELMPADNRKYISSNYQIIKARGKAVIISLVKYLKSMGVDLFVVHDRDKDVEKAAQFNQHILNAVGDPSKVLQMHECIEDELGYEAPSKDKPYRAFRYIESWSNWNDVPSSWREKMSVIFECDSQK